MGTQKEDDIIPQDDVVDDTNTVEGQLISAHASPRLSRHMLQQIKKYLSDADYPATKAELYASAKAQTASDSVLKALNTLQRDSYDSFDELNNEVSR
jgi:hypothetical protein